MKNYYHKRHQYLQFLTNKFSSEIMLSETVEVLALKSPISAMFVLYKGSILPTNIQFSKMTRQKYIVYIRLLKSCKNAIE